MHITNENHTRIIELTKIEAVEDRFPSCRVSINIKTEDLETNFKNYIWLAQTDVQKFLSELKQLGETRNGQAILKSMSPGQFKLKFQPFDNAGHLSVECNYNREDRLLYDYSFKIQVQFQIDPTILPTIRNNFLEFIA